MTKKPLSATMAIALGEAIEHGGKLVRHQGGYWTIPGAVMSATSRQVCVCADHRGRAAQS